MAIHILGIRHHGPGSCRNVLTYLQELQPDLILLEGPPEAETLLPAVLSEQMEPPVALLAYQPDEPQNAVFYPFAEFSPEWQTLRYALQNNVPVRFFDLPLAISMGLKKKEAEEQEAAAKRQEESEEGEGNIEGKENLPTEEKLPSGDNQPDIENFKDDSTDKDSTTKTVAAGSNATDEKYIAMRMTDGKAVEEDQKKINKKPNTEEEANEEEADDKEENEDDSIDSNFHGDPFNYLAEASGYTDGESWWEATVEHRRDAADIFQAVQEAVAALREELPEHTSPRDLLREAWMRRMLQAAQKENYERIAVVCGAWHVPALQAKVKVKDDNELLKGLPKVKIDCTWIPWTYDRLSYRSGYGAGINSPGWYHYLWHHPADDGTLWMAQVATLFRQKNMDISVAHVIETVRLAHATAALRGLSHPSLAEFNEAITTVMGFGDPILLQIIREELIISNRLGRVPDDVPKVPLLVDVEKTQKRLRTPFTTEIKEVTLDLRKPNDLDKSIFFHRLHLSDIDWCIPAYSDGKGTFKEKWTLYHKPEQIIAIIERAIWGNTLEEATQKYLLKQMADIRQIPELTRLLNRVIPADLPPLVDAMTVQLDNLSAASSDILEMMEAVPDLVNIVRYGSVRQLDFSKVAGMLQAMIARILAGGVLVCINIDEEAADNILAKLVSTDYAISILNDQELNDMWLGFIRQVRTAAHVHPLLSGYATRLLGDKGDITPEEMESTLSFYASPGNSPADIAYWFEGFLRSSGSILLLDDRLWNLVNNWICAQQPDTFTELLPIMKRTFSQFTTAERRKLGEKAKASGAGGVQVQSQSGTGAFNREEATRVLPVMHQLLGLEMTD